MSIRAPRLVFTCDVSLLADGTLLGNVPGEVYCSNALEVSRPMVDLHHGVVAALVTVNEELYEAGWEWLVSSVSHEYLVLCPEHAGVPVATRFENTRVVSTWTSVLP